MAFTRTMLLLFFCLSFLVLRQAATTANDGINQGGRRLAICDQLTRRLTSCVNRFGYRPRETCFANMYENIAQSSRLRRNRRRKCVKVERKLKKNCGCAGDWDGYSGPGLERAQDSPRMEKDTGLSSDVIENEKLEDLAPNVLCYYGDGVSYRGDVHTTISGLTCQNWLDQDPHEHSRTPYYYPGAGLGDHNLCRNPDGEAGPWCYTTDPGVRWELCKVDKCPDKYDFECQRGAGYMYRGNAQLTVEMRHCEPNIVKTITTVNYLEGRGANYAGTMSVTERGFTCRRWNDVDDLQLGSYGNHNYCRNPNGQMLRPWCYVKDENVDWDYCSVPKFWEVFNEAVSTETVHDNICRNSPFDDQMTGVWCYNDHSDKVLCLLKQCDDTPGNMEYQSDCMLQEDKGASYRGNTDMTINGVECQKWSAQNPHQHSQLDQSKGVGNHNFCRNPDNEPQPWCYTVDPDSRWDFCDIPICSEPALNGGSDLVYY